MATVALGRDVRAAGRRRGVLPALIRRALTDARTRTGGFGVLFALVAYVQPIAYRRAYPTLAERIGFARSFAGNKAVVLFYGKAYDLLTVGGYSAWRVGGTLAIFAAVFGALGAVRALRAEEDEGRAELVLAAAVGRRTAFAAALAAIAVGALVLWWAAFAGLLAGGLPPGGSAYLALVVTSVVPVFAGVGAVAGQLAPTRRLATEISGAVVALSLLLRVIGDTSSATWVRWLTPLGWAEQLRPFTGARPLALVIPAVACLILFAVAALLGSGRDIGTGVLRGRDRAQPRLRLLSSPMAQALRDERVGLLVWCGGVAAMALVIGIVSASVTSLGISPQLRSVLARLGAGSALTPRAYIGFSLSFFVLVVSLFAVAQIGGARHEEAVDRLETLLSLPVARRRWFGGRLLLAAAGITAVSLTTGLAAWLGAVTQHVSLSLGAMLGAGANCIPSALLFEGITALAYAALPRAGLAIGYGLVVLAFLWQLFGALLGAPAWLVHATPFAHVAAVPAVGFHPQAAAIMVVIGLTAALTAVGVLGRRDLVSA